MHPFSKSPKECIGTFSETELIQQIRDILGDVSPPSPRGIGDDCAVYKSNNKQQLITTDGIIYGRHFDDSVSPEDAAGKLIKRNISDIAAMGGDPENAVIAVYCGSDLKHSWFQKFYEGIKENCEKYEIKLLGGDLAQDCDSRFIANLTLIGSHEQATLRNQTVIGDKIYVTGKLGGSILGHHISFEPRIKEGSYLSKSAEAHSMIDLSDGLGKDLLSLLNSEQQAVLDTDLIPVSDDARRIANDSGKPPLFHVMSDGEDYELLFTVSNTVDESEFKKNWDKHFETPLSLIGQVKEKENPDAPSIIDSNNNPIDAAHGFEHFKTK